MQVNRIFGALLGRTLVVLSGNNSPAMADNKPDEGKSSKPKERQTNAGGAQRRTWDLEEYEKRARERAELGDEGVEGDVDDRPVSVLVLALADHGREERRSGRISERYGFRTTGATTTATATTTPPFPPAPFCLVGHGESYSGRRPRDRYE